MENGKHQPVLLNEVIHYLDPRPGNFIIDGTVDGGGHAQAIMEKIMPEGTFLGLDWDADMIVARNKAKQHGEKERYVHANYAALPEMLQRERLGRADGLLLDLGFSSEQLEQSGRGFSFGEAAAHEPLKMTYSETQRPVAELLRELPEQDLADIIHELGGERRSRKIAKAVKDAGRAHPIVTAGELADIVRSVAGKGYERGRIDPATRTFQALRIYANNELGNLETVLSRLREIVKPQGRVVVISFHSLEDRMVKRAFASAAKAGELEIVTKKPVAASREEEQRNPRSRSAKLRAARMLG